MGSGQSKPASITDVRGSEASKSVVKRNNIRKTNEKLERKEDRKLKLEKEKIKSEERIEIERLRVWHNVKLACVDKNRVKEHFAFLRLRVLSLDQSVMSTKIFTKIRSWQDRIKSHVISSASITICVLYCGNTLLTTIGGVFGTITNGINASVQNITYMAEHIITGMTFSLTSIRWAAGPDFIEIEVKSKKQLYFSLHTFVEQGIAEV